MEEGKKIRKERPPRYGLESILLGTIIAAGIAYLVYYAATRVGAIQPLQGAIIAGSLLWIGFTGGIFMVLKAGEHRKSEGKSGK